MRTVIPGIKGARNGLGIGKPNPRESAKRRLSAGRTTRYNKGLHHKFQKRILPTNFRDFDLRTVELPKGIGFKGRIPAWCSKKKPREAQVHENLHDNELGTEKDPLTFHYTLLFSRDPNPLYTLNNQGFFIAHFKTAMSCQMPCLNCCEGSIALPDSVASSHWESQHRPIKTTKQIGLETPSISEDWNNQSPNFVPKNCQVNYQIIYNKRI